MQCRGHFRSYCRRKARRGADGQTDARCGSDEGSRSVGRPVFYAPLGACVIIATAAEKSMFLLFSLWNWLIWFICITKRLILRPSSSFGHRHHHLIIFPSQPNDGRTDGRTDGQLKHANFNRYILSLSFCPSAVGGESVERRRESLAMRARINSNCPFSISLSLSLCGFSCGLISHSQIPNLK